VKVCTLTHTYPRFPDDINAPFVEKLMEHIALLGHDVSVLTAYDPEWRRRPDDHTVDLRTYRYIWPERFHVLGYSRTIEGNVRFRGRVFLLSPFLFAGAFRSFLKLVREKKPDILHAHWILPNGYIAGMVSRLTGVPLLIQLHGSDVFAAEKNALFRGMARSAASRADYILSPSPDLTRRLGDIGVEPSKIGLVPNTVEADFSESVRPSDVERLKRKLGIPGDRTIVLAMGRMVHVKGFPYLLEAFHRVAREAENVVLVLAGGGVLFDELRERADSMGIGDRVVMPGAVMRDEVPVYFRMADIFVIPSVRHESGAVDGLPVVVPEAMAAGLPIVGSDLSGIPVLIRNGKNGILVGERDIEGLAAAIGLLVADPGLRRRFGEYSRRIIREKVNYGTVAEYISYLYGEVASGKRLAGNIVPFAVDV